MKEALDNNDPEQGEVVFSPKVIVLFCCSVAYREFEKTPRKNARAFLNLVLSVARQNGLETKKTFADFIGNTWSKDLELVAFIEDIFLYISGVEFHDLWMGMQGQNFK